MKNCSNPVNLIPDFYVQSKSHCYVTKWPYSNGRYASNPKILYVNELTFNHSVMENIPAYNIMVSCPTRAPSNVSQGSMLIDKHYFKNSNLLNIPIQELLSLFETVCDLASHESDNVFDVFDAVKKRFHEMDDDQLASVLRNLEHSTVFQTYKRNELAYFWKEIDSICLNRWKTWPVEKLFYFIDLWYFLDLTKMSDFVFKSSMKFVNKPHM